MEPLDIRGGFAGTSARVSDLAVSVLALRSAEDRLATCARRLRAAYFAVEATTPVDPAAASARARASQALVDAALAAARQCAHAGGAADRLDRTATGYLEAEGGSSAAMAGLGSLWHSVRATVGARVAAARSEDGSIDWGNVLWTAPSMPRLAPTRDFVEVTLGALGPMYDSIARLLSEQAGKVSRILGDPRCLTLAPEVRATAPASTGVEDAFDKLHALSPEGGGGPGQISIERLEHADGTTAWTVAIPGTQDWLGFGGENPNDLTANLELAAKEVADPVLAVYAAMVAEGIPPGDPVMLVGHSQGAMAAMALANDDTFRSRYNVQAVATAGGPTGRYDTPSGVAVLHVEHTEDPTPGVDGAPNPDDPSRVTVSRSLMSSDFAADRAAARSNVGSHYCDVYARTGALIDLSPDPSVLRWKQEAEVFFGDHGDRVDRATYSVERGVEAVGDSASTPGR